jgi:transcriptional regulator with XRE-family HTH domain
MSTTLNTTKLADMLRSKRGNKGLRAVADEIGKISAPTLSRIEQGKVPDVETFIVLCNWLQVPTDTFIITNNANTSYKDQALAHLRADRELSPETINMLTRMIEFAYSSK